jgi:hypothetical protein
MLFCYPDNPRPESAGRVADLQSLLQSGNFDLFLPVLLPAFGVILEDMDEKKLYI